MMSRLSVIYDLSPSRPWLFATVNANRQLLESHNTVPAPFNPGNCELVPSHLIYWTIPEKKPIPVSIRNMLAELTRLLEAGKNVVMLSHTPSIVAHRSFERLWRQTPGLASHDIRVLFILGNPACVLEQRYREARVLLPEKTGHIHIRNYASLPILIKNAWRTWGENNVSLLANPGDSPVSRPNEALARDAFAFLGCPAPAPLPHLPRHPLCLASIAGRRLSLTPEVRNNAWPPLDEGLFMDTLASVERDWETAPVSPLYIREALIRNGSDSLAEMEEMLGLQSGALACPDWLAQQPEADMAAPLPEDKVRLFAEALPKPVRKPLGKRFINDAVALNADQKTLAQALAATEGNDYGAIGEPVPPVELTVLTMTYNHEKYIAQCMDSVLAQQTSFPIRHIVLDHHSADGTPQIVAEYAKKHSSIQPVLLSHHRPAENVMGLFLRCRTKYAALCDGDDYFTDPLKLQKQVDFLENHPSCAMCFHPVDMVFEDGREPLIFPSHKQLPRGVHEEYYLMDLVRKNFIQTNSAVYRWRFQDGMPQWFRPDLCPGDWYWHLLHAEMGKIGFLPEVMSAYRRHAGALFINAANPRKNRRLYGMKELETCHVINQHFQNRYFPALASLASVIFGDFLEIDAEENDPTLLRQACVKYPDFAAYFSAELKKINSGQTVQETTANKKESKPQG